MSDIKINQDGTTVKAAKLNLEGDVVLEGCIGRIIEELRAEVDALSSVVSVQEQMIEAIHGELQLKADNNDILSLLNLNMYGNNTIKENE